MPQVTHAKSKRPSLIVIGLIVFVVVVVPASYLNWRLNVHAQKVANQAYDYNKHGKYSLSKSLLEPVYHRAVLKNDKIILVTALAGTARGSGDNAQALVYLKALDKLQPNTFSTLTNIAEVSELTGDKAGAVAAYREALTTLKAAPVGPRQADVQARLEAKIAALEKQS